MGSGQVGSGQMARWAVGRWADEQVGSRQVGRWAGRQMGRWADRQIGRWAGRQMGRWAVGRWADGQVGSDYGPWSDRINRCNIFPRRSDASRMFLVSDSAVNPTRLESVTWVSSSFNDPCETLRNWMYSPVLSLP